MTTGPSLYERVGRAFFERLVADFYAEVEHDALLRPMYEADLAPAKERLASFLMQYFGGPADYEALRGEPRLRMRHLRFPIDEAARDAWLACMGTALSKASCTEADRAELAGYFEQAANFFMNQGLRFVGGPSRGRSVGP